MTDLHVHILPGVDDGSQFVHLPLKWQKWRQKRGAYPRGDAACKPDGNRRRGGRIRQLRIGTVRRAIYRLEREINREHIPISLVRGMEIMSIGTAGEKNQREKADTAP